MTQNQIYDLGYNDLKKAEELAQIAHALGAVVADIRFMPHTRNPEFGQKHLVEVLGASYIHVGALGNQNYRGEGAVQLVDAEKGLALINNLLKVKPVIIMCACWKRSECHRVHVADEYLSRFNVESIPLTKSAARTLLSELTANANPQLTLFP